jgi:protoporphyrin/coproporphyrin ferrochelatase
MAEGTPVGVVVMAYGTPRSPDDVEAYYTHIRRGRPPTPELLAELQARYDAIGGTSPLAAITESQRAGIEAALEASAPGRFRVVLGQKHAAPFIEDAAAELLAAGVDRAVGLVLAPHYSGFSVGQYQERLAAAMSEGGGTATGVRSWHLEPTYVDFLARAVRDALAELPERTKVLFTAHSLPERVLATPGADGELDPYPDQLQASAAAVAAEAGLDRWAGWSLCWQSAGRTPEPWRGPDILDVIRDLADTGRAEGVLVCPQGFVADHLEVVYDLDIEARAVAEPLGLAFARTRVLNDDEQVLGALADRVVELADDSWRTRG